MENPYLKVAEEIVLGHKPKETPLLELAESNLLRAKQNYAWAVRNLEDCMRHMMEQEACVERLKEEAEGKPF